MRRKFQLIIVSQWQKRTAAIALEAYTLYTIQVNCNYFNIKYDARPVLIIPFKVITQPRGRVGRVTDCGVRGLGFKSPGSILTSRAETSSLSRVVRRGWDPCSVPVSE